MEVRAEDDEQRLGDRVGVRVRGRVRVRVRDDEERLALDPVHVALELLLRAWSGLGLG